jgi:hypothetical protein
MAPHVHGKQAKAGLLSILCHQASMICMCMLP